MKHKPALIWDRWNKRHIKKHNVSVEEVEQAYTNSIANTATYANRQIIYGITKENRIMAIIISFEKQKEPYVITARDATNKERRTYHDKT